MSAVRLEKVSKRYAGVTALSEISLKVEDGELLTLLGPSGSGKSTLLNTISGMIAPTSGRIFFDGEDVTHMPAGKRGLGMVFQNYALVPHMSVFDNIAYPLRIRKVPSAELKRQVDKYLALVRLSDFAERRPGELSGGQQQRVSIARCLVYEPRLVLMDEPLGALDKKLREEIQLEIKRIHKDLGVTIIYVTHDQQEALVLSDRICVLANGEIEQLGTPNQLYFEPATIFVAKFFGKSNFIPGILKTQDGGAMIVQSANGSTIQCVGANGCVDGEKVFAQVRPEALKISNVEAQDKNCLRGKVIQRQFLGDSTLYVMRIGDSFCMEAQIQNCAKGANWEVGNEVFMSFSKADVRVMSH